MIQLYKHNNNNYEWNADFILTECTKCHIPRHELNGQFELELEHRYDKDGIWKNLIIDAVIKAPTPQGYQLFRIYKTEKDMFSLKVYARHIFFDLCCNLILDARPTNTNGKGYLDALLVNTDFKGYSNIVKTNTSYFIRKNIVECLIGADENSFINRLGGELYIDNFDIYMNEHIGHDNGVEVVFGKNLKEIEEIIDSTNVVTRIVPVGYNGIMLEGNKPWVDSPKIKNYIKISVREMKFDDIKIKERPEDKEGFNTLEEARQAMIDRCNKLFESGLDTPNINYKVSMELLQNTIEYKDFEILETVKLGDTVTCKHNGIGIDIKARCISYSYNCLTEKYIEIELGQFIRNYFEVQSDIYNRVNKAIDQKGNVVAEEVKGVIDATNAKFKAQRNVEQRQHIRAMLFEDTDIASPTYGAMSIGTQGFQIASKRTADGKDWEWSTFGTGKGFIADLIVAGKILGNNAELNLDKGFLKITHQDGSYTILDKDGVFNVNGADKRRYRYLNYTHVKDFYTELDQGVIQDIPATGEYIIDLPSSFENIDRKDITVICSIQDVGHQGQGAYGIQRMNFEHTFLQDNRLKIDYVVIIKEYVFNSNGYVEGKYLKNLTALKINTIVSA